MLFQEQKRKGVVGETAIINHYRQKGCIVEDTTNNRDFFDMDIDLFINGQSVEVKTSNNIEKFDSITVELISNTDSKRYKDGWFITSKAEVFIFYSPQTKISYQVIAEELRRCYAENENKCRHRYYTCNEFGNVNKESLLAYIPLEVIKSECKTFRQEVID